MVHVKGWVCEKQNNDTPDHNKDASYPLITPTTGNYIIILNSLEMIDFQFDINLHDQISKKLHLMSIQINDHGFGHTFHVLKKKLEKDTILTLVLTHLSTYMIVWKLPGMANTPTSHECHV